MWFIIHFLIFFFFLYIFLEIPMYDCNRAYYCQLSHDNLGRTSSSKARVYWWTILRKGQCSVQMIKQESWLGIIRLFLLYQDLLVEKTPDPCLIRWCRLGKMFMSSNSLLSVLGCYTYEGKSWLSRKITGGGVNFSGIRQTGHCRSLFLSITE